MPTSVTSFRIRILLVLGAGIVCAYWWRSTAPSAAFHRALVPSNVQSTPATMIASSARARRSARTAENATPSRDEVVAYLLATYRKELLTRELDLEQGRYGDAYWKSGPSGSALARLRAERAALVAELTAEANQVLTSILPQERANPIALTPFFDEDHPAPNVGFLSAESRERFEAQVLTSGVTRAEDLADVAAATLTAPELVLYRSWNDRRNAALRNELIGFDATETEFLAIRDARANNEGATPAAQANLEAQLGHERYSQLAQLENPAFRTAIQELNRLGLPLANASWLATTREAATAAIQQIWQDKTLPDSAKADRVALLQREYGQAVATKLALPGSDLDELGVAQQ